MSIHLQLDDDYNDDYNDDEDHDDDLEDTEYNLNTDVGNKYESDVDANQRERIG